MVFKVYAGPLGHTYAQLYQYCGSLICIGQACRLQNYWGQQKEPIKHDPNHPKSINMISTYQQSPTCHQRVTNVSPTCYQRVTNVSPVICLTDRPFVRPEVTPNIGKFACATSCRLPWWRATWPPEGFSNDISVQNLGWLSTFLGDYTILYPPFFGVDDQNFIGGILVNQPMEW